MEHNFKKLLVSLRPRETRELISDHVRRVEISASGHGVTLHVDKRYAFNAIVSHDHVENVIKGVKRAFGGECATTIQLDANHAGSEREKALPRAIHYR